MTEAKSSCDLVRRMLDGRPVERPPVVMHLAEYAARLGQLSYQQLSADATLLSNGLQGAQRLFACDGLVLTGDTTLEAEALGCGVVWQEDEARVASHPFGGGNSLPIATLAGMETRGRLAVALDAARRLRAVISKETALLPAVTGPVTLAAHLRGPSLVYELSDDWVQAEPALDVAMQATLHLAKQYLELGFEQLLVVDPFLGRLASPVQAQIGSLCRPLWNVADFYDATLLLQTRAPDGDRLDSLLQLGAGGLVVEGGLPLGEIAQRAELQGKCVAVGVPPELLEAGQGSVEAVVSAWRADGCNSKTFFACCRLPRAAAPETVQQALRGLRG